MFTKKVSENLIKSATHHRDKNFEQALLGYKKILKENPDLSFVKALIIDCYYKQGEFPTVINLGKELLESTDEKRDIEKTMWFVIFSYIRLNDLESAKVTYLLYKPKVPYLTFDFNIEKLQFLTKINSSQSTLYKKAIYFAKFLTVFHEATDNKVKNIENTHYHLLWYRFVGFLGLPPTLDLFNWMDEYEENIYEIEDITLNQAQLLAQLNSKEIKAILNSVGLSSEGTLSKKESIELEKIRDTFYFKIENKV